MNTTLPENEWADLSDDEIAACANWEVWRESCRRDGRPIESAWLELNAKQKARAKKSCPVVWFGCPRLAVFDEPVFGATDEVMGGKKLVSAEFVELGIHWDTTDKEIRDGFALWLKKQRLQNPNARHFRKTGGNRINPMSVLVSIAMLRADAAGLSREDAKRGLLELIKKSSCNTRFYAKYYKEALRDAEGIFKKIEPPRHAC